MASGDDAPGDRLLTFADRLRRSEEEDAEREEKPEIWVSFQLAGRSFALPVMHVREFAPIDRITRVPGAPSIVRGVTNVRGHAIPVVNLRELLGLPGQSPADPNRILVVDYQGRWIGLVVDRVDRVLTLSPSRIQGETSIEGLTIADNILGCYETDDDSLLLLSASTFLDRRETTG